MSLSIKSISKIFKRAFKEWMSKDPFKESAVIAYYSIFSLPGLLVVIVSFVGYFYGRDAVNDHIAKQFTATFGKDTADQIQEMIIKASEFKNSIWATIIGVITILVGATGVFAQFQKSLNIIWEVKADPDKSGIWNLIKIRLFSFGLIISIAFILIVSLVVSASLAAFGNWLTNRFSESVLILLQALNFLISFSILSLLFALIFKIMPDAKVKWRHVWIGSVVTAFLFEIGKFGLSLYFGKANPGSGYGTAGSIILILLWVSYSSMIVFYGAEFTRAVADHVTGNVPASEVAIKDKGREA
jgi:membrane protein